MCIFDIYKWAVRSGKGLNLTLGMGLISMHPIMCLSHVFVIHLYNSFSSPISHCDGKRDC